MSMTSQEILKALAQANDATIELRRTVKDAHAARKDLTATVKEHRDAVNRAIEEEVARQVSAVTEQVREEMRAAVTETMARFEADWRAKVGLSRSRVPV